MKEITIKLITPSEELPSIDDNILFKTEYGWCTGYYLNDDDEFIEEDSKLNDIRKFKQEEVQYWVNMKDLI